MTNFAEKPAISIAFAMLIGLFGFTTWTVGDAMIRYLNTYHPFQVAFVSTSFGLLFMFIASPILGGIKASMKKPKMKLQVLRGFILSISGLLSFYVFANLDLATAYALIFCAPFIGKILSVVLNKESIRLRSWVITAIGFTGVLIVLRPGVIPIGLPAIGAIVMSFFFAFGHIMGRYIGQENQTLFNQVFWGKFFNWIVVAPPMFWMMNSMPVEHIAICALMGFTGIFGSFLVSWAFSVAPAAYIAPIHYTQILFGSLWGILLFSEYPDTWTYIGGSVIIGAGIALAYLGHKKDAKKLGVRNA